MSLLRFFQKRRRDEELASEIESYIGHETDDNIARGMDPFAARTAAHRKLGNRTSIREAEHRMNSIGFMETTVADLRFALRGLIKNPGFTFFAVLTIALGLGANAAIFSLVDGVLLKSSGYPEPERLVMLWEKPPQGTRNGISAANYMDWAKQSQSFEAMAAVTGTTMTYTGGGEPKPFIVDTVSAPYFDVFGIKAAQGRTFSRDEDQAGKEKVAVLSHRLWNTQFGADPKLVGQRIPLNGEPFTVIGILPGAGEFDRRNTDLYIPLVFPPNAARDYHFLIAYARLKPGVSIEAARAEMSSIAGGIAERYPAIKKDWGATVDRFLDRVVGPQLRQSLTILMCAVAAILLIGCANLANLLMARATLRSREIALRIALGASRVRVVRLLLTESLLLSALGSAAGVALGFGLLRWIESLLPPFYFPAEANVSMDGRVMLFLGIITVLTGIAFGLAPALEASRGDSAEALKEGGRSNSAGRGRLLTRHIFVAAQVAAAFILLAGGGLLMRSFDRLMKLDLGFDSQGLIAAYLPLPMERNPEPVKLTQYVDSILEAVRSVPGIRAAAVATAIPLRGWGDGMPFVLPDKPNDIVGTGFKIILPSYFQALGLRLRAGRLLDERDTAGSPPVVVVNDSFVKRYFPDVEPLGKRILVEKILPTRRGLGPRTSWEIVGVVPDERGNGLESPTDIGAYASFAQNPVVGLGLIAKGGGDGAAIIKPVQQAIWRVNKDQLLDRAMTVDERKMNSMMSRRLTTSLMGGFALLAMLLACAGVYGVLSFVTARRSQEIGIRAAMGATRADLIKMVVAGGARPVIIGIGIGLAGALGLASFIKSMLFATDPYDLPTLAAVSALFLAVAFLACFVPAWRASRVDPMAALRQE